MELPRTSHRYRSRRDDTALRERLLAVAREKPLFGYRRRWIELARDPTAPRVNHKRCGACIATWVYV